MITEQTIQTSTAINEQSRLWALQHIAYINGPRPLLGKSRKTDKGLKEGYYTSVLYMQPADKVATKTLCAGAKFAGCKAGCLIGSGQLGMSIAQNAATRRTILYLLDRERFYAMLRREIEREHAKYGEKLAVRLNGTSDIDHGAFIATMPHIRFYDYTKIYGRILANTLPNYDLTYSGSAYTAKSISMTARAINDGHRVAIAFNTAECVGEFQVPDTLADFDTTDLRFLDRPVLGALKYKGGSIAERKTNTGRPSFFFTLESYKALNSLIATDRGI